MLTWIVVASWDGVLPQRRWVCSILGCSILGKLSGPCHASMFGTVAVQIWLLEEDLYGGSCLIYINRSTGQRTLLLTPTNLQWCAICSHNCHFLKAFSFKPDNEQAPLHSVHRAMPLAQVLSRPCMQSTWLIKLLLAPLRQTRQDWGPPSNGLWLGQINAFWISGKTVFKLGIFRFNPAGFSCLPK